MILTWVKAARALPIIFSSSNNKGEEQMFRIKIFCPTEGRLVDTGVTTDRETYQKLRAGGTPVRCPACNNIHYLSERQATHATRERAETSPIA
jgi:hypothetical protein